MATSALGDGMSAVAIAWLALKIAPESSRGLWVGAAVAAYSLPGAAGAVVLRRWLRGRAGTRLAFANAVLRTLALGLVGILALAGALDPAGYVGLLGVSSLLSAWGAAGKYTLIADLLPAEQRVAGNTVFGLSDQVSLMIGPALAGIVTALTGPAVVIAADAVSWAVLAVSYARVTPLVARTFADRAANASAAGAGSAVGGSTARASAGVGGSARTEPAPAGAWALIRSTPLLPGLLAMSFFFYLLYGPVEVALPVHIADDLHGSAALLGVFWAVFGIGAIIGELAAPFLRRLPVWPTMTAIVFGWGLALIPLGFNLPLGVVLGAFFAGALIWGPWMSLSMAVFQEAAPPEALAQVLAARGSLLILASPLGTALGGPIVAAIGARGALLVSALGTVAVGVVAATILATGRRR